MGLQRLFTAIAVCLLTIGFVKSADAHGYFSWLNACKDYRAMVEEILESERVDRSFYYLMVAESRCKERATSNKGARGFWQLMPATSRHYGCDDPDNLECATRAAAKYLKRLSDEFSSFEEIIMAWNMGGHNYARRGAGPEARGLAKRVKDLIKTDSLIKETKDAEEERRAD